MVTFVNGAALPVHLQREVLRRYVHRFTRDHVPAWTRDTRPNGKPYRVQFASDADWLANTDFPVTKAGAIADLPAHCNSRPTWPEGRE